VYDSVSVIEENSHDRWTWLAGAIDRFGYSCTPFWSEQGG
jgi:hypothetical protein